MEYELHYNTRRFCVLFEMTVTHVTCTIYNKDRDEWIEQAKASTEHNQETDFSNCRKLLKDLHKVLA